MLPIKARFIHNEDRLRGLISVLWSPWRAGESKCSLLVNTGSLLKHFTLVGSTVFESVPSSRSASRYFCSWLFALRFRSDWRGSLISLGWTAASRILYQRNLSECKPRCTWPPNTASVTFISVIHQQSSRIHPHTHPAVDFCCQPVPPGNTSQLVPPGI